MSDPRSSRFVRAMSAIGDLDSPHYADERTRYVWYEASAIAAQLYLWGGMAIATAMIWLGGRTQLGWSALVLGFTLAVAFCLVRYADAFRAPVEMTPTDLRSPEVIGVMLMLASYVVGVVFAMGDSASGGVVAGFRAGILPGLVGGVIAIVWGVRRDARRKARQPQEQVEDED